LISAVVHAHRTELHKEAPDFFDPLPLDEVVSTLWGTGDRFTRELAACWLLDSQAREATLKPYAAQLLRQDLPREPLFPPNVPDSISFGQIPKDGHLCETRMSLACAALLSATNCTRHDYRIRASCDPYSLVTSVEASVQVQRPAVDFQQLSDPRVWAERAPLFFKESKLCQLVECDFVTVTAPFPPGSKAYRHPLLEHVTLGFSPLFPIEGQNVLAVTCDPLKQDPEFNVSLYASLETLMGMSYARGGLDVDGGRFLASRIEPDLTKLSGTKLARFSERELFGYPVGRWANLFAPFMLAPFMATMVFEGACA
jgi:hypothetical protein